MVVRVDESNCFHLRNALKEKKREKRKERKKERKKKERKRERKRGQRDVRHHTGLRAMGCIVQICCEDWDPSEQNSAVQRL